MENQPSDDEISTSIDMSPSVSSANPEVSQSNNVGEDSSCSGDALAKALSSMLTSLIKDFDSKSQATLSSQDQVSAAIDRLTRELDQLLEDAPLPFIMQHAAKISSVRKRVSSLNSLLKSIQKRLDDIDLVLSLGKLNEKSATESC